MAYLSYSTPYIGSLRRKKARDPLVSEGFDLANFENEILSDDFYESKHSGNRRVGLEEEATKRAFPFATTSEISVADGQTFSEDSAKPHKISNLHEDFVRVKNAQSMWMAFVWPAFAICVPMVLLAAALLYICYKYRVDETDSIFRHHDEKSLPRDNRHLLVNFPATKLVFLASFLSTLAPLLAGCIMNLVAVLVYQDLERSSNVANFPLLPTPYQISLLIGVLAASYEQLFSSFGYLLSSKRTAKVSPVLLYAVSIFLLTVVLGIAVAATDAFLHIATQTVSITIYSDKDVALFELGRGINSYCLGVNRSDNFGYPCTMAATSSLGKTQEWQNGQAEIQRIAHNTSTKSTVHLDSPGSIAYLVPAIVPQDMDFAATTIGVSGECSLLPPSAMNITVWGDNNISTSFNYSSNFWGTLGLTPPEAALGTGKALSPYLAFLSINQNANLIYNYFADEELSIVYNTADLNATAYPTDTSRPWSDSELKNPVYLGFAWRTATGSFAGFSKNGMVNSTMVHKYQSNSFIDYFLKCELTSYNVTYMLMNSTIRMVDAIKHDNGSLLNMWTGMAAYYPRVSASDFNLQDYNIQSAIAGNSSESYLTRFGDLLSQSALSTIGAFTSDREVLQQQRYTTMLVAKVPKTALGALLACSLLYPVFGMILFLKALQASKSVGPMAPILSYWGLTWAAFLQNRQEQMPAMVENETKPHVEEGALRLFIRRNEESGPQFGLYKRSGTGQITEIERSETNVAAWL